ncbi:unnamed protein product, partial [Meganyctiphanes norvegica]
ESDINQLCVVLQTLGTPNEATWPGLTNLPDYKKITFPQSQPVPLEQVLPDAPTEAIDLIKKFLVYHSEKRIPAKKALIHAYFFTAPMAAATCDLPLPQKEKRPAPATQEYVTDLPMSVIAERVSNHLHRITKK